MVDSQGQTRRSAPSSAEEEEELGDEELDVQWEQEVSAQEVDEEEEEEAEEIEEANALIPTRASSPADFRHPEKNQSARLHPAASENIYIYINASWIYLDFSGFFLNINHRR